MFVSLFMAVGVITRRHETSVISQNQNIFQSSKKVSPHPSLFKVIDQQCQEQRDTVEIKYILVIALSL